MTQAIAPMDLGHEDAAATSRLTGRADLQVTEALNAVAAGQAPQIVRMVRDLAIELIRVDPMVQAVQTAHL
jgi:hypothetical protein